ncbi:MAG: PQQ-binding-like beta-propeller repeat protein [Verrucomicrobiota bacterium]
MRIPILLLLFATSALASDWPGWRGPQGDNHAPQGASPVTEWSERKNVRWKAALPGKGHATPIFVGNRIYLPTGDEEAETQSLLAYDRESGELVWNTLIHQGGLAEGIHRENSFASSTARWDGKNILVVFENQKQIHVTAVDPDGEIVWSKSLGRYATKPRFGFGSTPALYGDLLIVAVESENNGFLIGIDSQNGAERWKTARPGRSNWATPVVAKVAGRDQLLISGTGKVSSYDPSNGRTLWEVPSKLEVACGTAVWWEDMVFASGGFPAKETLGVKATGRGQVVWSTPVKCYEQSMLSVGGFIYGIDEQSTAFCWRASDGELMWKERLGRGGIKASPLLVGDLIYASLLGGTTVVFRASSDGFEKVAENQLGDQAYASPVALEDELFLRVAFKNRGHREEFLYCLGE